MHKQYLHVRSHGNLTEIIFIVTTNNLLWVPIETVDGRFTALYQPN